MGGITTFSCCSFGMDQILTGLITHPPFVVDQGEPLMRLAPDG